MSLSVKRSRRVQQCLRCGGVKVHEARGLCKCCYNHLREGRCRSGERLDDYPLSSGAGHWVGLTAAGDETAAERLRRQLDPRHIPAKEARREAA